MKSEYSGEELLSMWHESGLPKRELARRLNLNFDAMHGKIFRAQKRPRKMEDITEGNKRTIKVRGRIKTLDDLIKYAEIDTNVWEITKYKINKWEGYRREEIKNIEYIDGKANGFVEDTGNIKVEPLWQVEAHMIKKEPEAIHPVISPVVISPQKRTNFRNRKVSNSVMILADPHIGFSKNTRTNKLTPFHDRRAMDIALNIASNNTFDKIIVLGDLLDLAEWSDKFARSPEMYFTTQAALIEAAWYLTQLKSLSNEVYLLEGNHEERLMRMILRQMLMAYELGTADNPEIPVLSIPNLLSLDKIGVKYIGGYPDGELWINDSIVCTHGSRVNAKSGRTVSAIIDEINSTHIFGHIHRIETASRTIYSRDGYKTIQAHSPGCLCRIDGVVPGKKKKQNWQQGLSVVNSTSEFHQIVSVPIDNGSAIFNNKIYNGSDYKQKLSNDTNWNF